MSNIPTITIALSDSHALIIFSIIQCIYMFVLCPITIYYTNQLWKLHKDKVLFITKRRPQSVIFGIILLNFYPIIVRLITDFPQIYPPLSHLMVREEIRMTLVDVAHLILYFLFSRVWLLYYDYERNMHLIRIQWQNHIKIKRDGEKYTPWTLKHKNLGNTTVMAVIVIISWLIAMVIVQFGSFTNILNILYLLNSIQITIQ